MYICILNSWTQSAQRLSKFKNVTAAVCGKQSLILSKKEIVVRFQGFSMDYKELLCNKLKHQFGFDYKNEKQKKATETVYQGTLVNKRDVFINFPSGFGKSLCFQLPVMARDHSFGIVITPTLALAENHVAFLRSKNVVAYHWYSDSPKTIKRLIKKDITSSKPKIKLLYVSPEQCRLGHFQVTLAKVHPRISYYFVIDEAHCLSPWSHDFKICYKNLSKIREKISHVPIVVVSATITKKVKVDILKVLKLKDPLLLCSKSVSRSNLIYDVQFIDFLQNPLLDLKRFILQSLEANNETTTKNKDSGIIFCKKECSEELTKDLISMGIQTLNYHQLNFAKSRKTLQMWDSGECQVIIAPNHFGLGISKPSVRFVVHWGAPQSIAHYYQESGRAGHDGNLSYCRVYCTYKEMKEPLVYAKREMFLSDLHVIYQPTQTMLFAQIIHSFTQLKCRHAVISSYFGEILSDCINKCDICTNKNIVSQKVTFLLKQGSLSLDERKTLFKEFMLKLKKIEDEKNKITDVVKSKSALKSNSRIRPRLNASEIKNLIVNNLNVERPRLRKVAASEELDKIKKILYS